MSYKFVSAHKSWGYKLSVHGSKIRPLFLSQTPGITRWSRMSHTLLAHAHFNTDVMKII